MPIVRHSAKTAKKAARVDRAKIGATTEQDIARQRAADDTPDAAKLKLRRVVPAGAVDVAAIRAETGLSQDEFSARYGFSKRTVQEWEQFRKRPTGPARALLTVIQRYPREVARALRAEMPDKG
jgi:putative transcriptional regulator